MKKNKLLKSAFAFMFFWAAPGPQAEAMQRSQVMQPAQAVQAAETPQEQAKKTKMVLPEGMTAGHKLLFLASFLVKHFSWAIDHYKSEMTEEKETKARNNYHNFALTLDSLWKKRYAVSEKIDEGYYCEEKDLEKLNQILDGLAQEIKNMSQGFFHGPAQQVQNPVRKTFLKECEDFLESVKTEETKLMNILKGIKESLKKDLDGMRGHAWKALEYPPGSSLYDASSAIEEVKLKVHEFRKAYREYLAYDKMFLMGMIYEKQVGENVMETCFSYVPKDLLSCYNERKAAIKKWYVNDASLRVRTINVIEAMEAAEEDKAGLGDLPEKETFLKDCLLNTENIYENIRCIKNYKGGLDPQKTKEFDERVKSYL